MHIFEANVLGKHLLIRYFPRMPPGRLKVLKTYKLYIGGKFPRTESGRTMTASDARTGAHLAHYCHASRKDFRDAVVAARSAQPGWPWRQHTRPGWASSSKKRSPARYWS